MYITIYYTVWCDLFALCFFFFCLYVLQRKMWVDRSVGGWCGQWLVAILRLKPQFAVWYQITSEFDLTDFHLSKPYKTEGGRDIVPLRGGAGPDTRARISIRGN